MTIIIIEEEEEEEGGGGGGGGGGEGEEEEEEEYAIINLCREIIQTGNNGKSTFKYLISYAFLTGEETLPPLQGIRLYLNVSISGFRPQQVRILVVTRIVRADKKD
ncbi:hypothetical protein PoB_004112700 [Plakobranchus ocellatus]|uniref:Uncharacterized protein n=1 Tax=Plakobranchus ocellatus TaxID=259542 RepID=A0AAV4B618_9GAST|nr:hypothetical protein PoB_004112700 [Plakobranchus ocellatus]